MLEDALSYAYFDKEMPEEEKDRILTFYEHCLQRHLYACADSRQHYLSKNPHFTPMIDTLLQYFPDAKIIYLVRNPFDMIPSLISMKDYEWQLFGDPLEKYACRDYVLDVTLHWYTYPLEILENTCGQDYVVINFKDLVDDPESTVSHIYKHFGLKINSSFAQALKVEAENARHHQSEHDYSLVDMKINPDQILTEYAEVFDRFGFNTDHESVD
jgi:hypothetical protein